MNLVCFMINVTIIINGKRHLHWKRLEQPFAIISLSNEWYYWTQPALYTTGSVAPNEERRLINRLVGQSLNSHLWVGMLGRRERIRPCSSRCGDTERERMWWTGVLCWSGTSRVDVESRCLSLPRPSAAASVTAVHKTKRHRNTHEYLDVGE